MHVAHKSKLYNLQKMLSLFQEILFKKNFQKVKERNFTQLNTENI